MSERDHAININLTRWMLEEFASIETQRRVWLGRSPDEVSSFEEAACGLFDDASVSIALENGSLREEFGPEIAGYFQRMDRLLDDIPDGLIQEAYIAHPAMAEIRTIAQTLLDTGAFGEPEDSPRGTTPDAANTPVPAVQAPCTPRHQPGMTMQDGKGRTVRGALSFYALFALAGAACLPATYEFTRWGYMWISLGIIAAFGVAAASISWCAKSNRRLRGLHWRAALGFGVGAVVSNAVGFSHYYITYGYRDPKLSVGVEVTIIELVVICAIGIAAQSMTFAILRRISRSKRHTDDTQ